ncbi:vacuolar protein sorting-associated protein 54-like [Convolutriloba macropyga]|uniref:vacuolar protein sorting-associated protein 54-like n=1 Tax=Convolutriloba macropyga TaxID=536237 RepID=UPI003F523FDC
MVPILEFHIGQMIFRANGSAAEITMFQSPSWKTCILCPDEKFYGIKDFTFHLRELHCKKEGGSFTCHYGTNNLCQFLPLEGVSDRDYEQHVLKIHVKIPAEMTELDLAPILPSNEAPSPPSVVADQQKWTYYKSSVNMPALLNDPAKGKQSDIFTQTWGSDFQRSDISPTKRLPEIPPKLFRSYLKKTHSRLKTHFNDANDCPVSPPAPSIEHQKESQLNEELKSIPQFYSLSSFDLNDRDLFFRVFPSEKVPLKVGPSDESSLSPGSSVYNLMSGLRNYHEKLTHQLDIVEMHISSHISKQSSTFFNAMTSHGDIQKDIQRTQLAVEATREKLSNAHEFAISNNLQLLPLIQKRHRHFQIFSMLRMIATVQQTQPTIQLLLANSDYTGALELIQFTQDILAKDLVGVKAFRHLKPQLDELKNVIDAMVGNEIRTYFHEDLARPLDDTENFVSNAHTLSQLVQALLHLKKYSFLELYKEECILAVAPLFKSIVINTLSQSDASDVDTRESLCAQMRKLDFNQWLGLYKEVLTKMMLLLKRVHATLALVLEEDKRRLQDAEQPQLLIGDSQDLQKNVKQTLNNLCDQIHEKCKTLLLSRNKNGFFERLSMSEFVRFTRTCEEFATSTEALMDRRGSSVIRLTLASCSVSFISKFHDDQKSKLIILLESERWIQAEIPAEFQNLASNIEESGFFETVFSESVKLSDRILDRLSFKGVNYSLVGTNLILLKMVSAYCQLVEQVPSLASDLLTKVTELLKLFNLKSNQLVLGAQAVEILQLKSINSKNLALCYSSLKFVSSILPDLKSFFERHLTANQQNTYLKELANAGKDFDQSCSDLVNQLYSVLEKTVDRHIVKCLTDLKPPAPSATMRSLTSLMGKFHQAVWNILPESISLQLFQKCNEFISNKVTAMIETGIVNLNDDGDGDSPSQILLLSEMNFYQDCINSLTGLEGITLKHSLITS